MKKVDKKDWLEEGLKLLAAEGFQKITIDNMCKILKVSKGSFYHHFKNIEGYVEELMKYWQEKNTVDFIKNTDAISDINEKHIQLNELASSASQKAEQVIRAWSFSNETVRKYVEQVDTIRMEYLISLNIQSGMTTKEAKNYAILEYGVLIGVQQLCPDISKEDFKQLYILFRNKAK